jgi:hypothetical protein
MQQTVILARFFSAPAERPLRLCVNFLSNSVIPSGACAARNPSSIFAYPKKQNGAMQSRRPEAKRKT